MASKEEMIQAILNMSESEKEMLEKLPKWEVFEVDPNIQKEPEYSDEEIEVLTRKLEHPDEEVICPRCGNRLIYTEYNCGCKVECKTKGCIRDAIRGL